RPPAPTVPPYTALFRSPPERHGVGQDEETTEDHRHDGAVDEAGEARDAGPDEDRQQRAAQDRPQPDPGSGREQAVVPHLDVVPRSEEHTSELQSRENLV